ncbi:MAG: glycosyltransferase [Crocinitomicaceae bacterium]|tara:strand:+ start:211 stop:1332 length:1122 start_codon:yes stop_codon:yes gene_type:complete
MKFKKKAIVCVSNDLVTDNRVAKTCQVLKDLNYSVYLVGRRKEDSPKMNHRTYKYRRLKLSFEKGALFYMNLNMRLFLFLIFRKSDLIYSNDLDTLLPCYLVSKIKKTRLIYDTHELFTEVAELKNRSFIRNIWLTIEKNIFPKLQTVITVNDSIAEIYNKKYGVEVTSIRNVPALLNNDQDIQTRISLDIAKDTFILIIQGSGLNKDRGIEEAILAMTACSDCVLLLVGDGDIIPSAKNIVRSHQLESKVKFISRRPYVELMKITRLADLGLLLDKNTNLNHELALPNKLFDYIHASTPILSSRLKEISIIIEKHNIGIFIEKIEPNTIAAAIMGYKKDLTLINKHRENCQTASKTENWQVEKEKLIQLLVN